MLMSSIFHNRTYAVFGLGVSGEAACRFLLKKGANVLCWDDNKQARDKFDEFQDNLVEPGKWDWKNIEALVLAAGIPHTYPKPHIVAANAKIHGCEIISDVELLYRTNPSATFIGVTGTNGKSTTTALIGHILQHAFGKLKIQIGGNIGTPALSLDVSSPNRIYVLELSSYQLDLIKSFHPGISVLLNITPDHLERHGGMNGYIKAKSKIFQNQTNNDYAIIGDNDTCKNVIKTLEAQESSPNIIEISLKNIGNTKHLIGEHNKQNIAAAVHIARLIGISEMSIRDSIDAFKGLKHRCEVLKQIGQVTFINDSKGTNADATSKALSSFNNIYWIAGGVAKKGGIENLSRYFNKIKHAFLIGESTDEFACTLDKYDIKYTKCKSLKQAVERSYKHARDSSNKRATVLLSPSAASFDMWNNFEDRGDAFRDIVDFLR